jgi:hypothetical protein
MKIRQPQLRWKDQLTLQEDRTMHGLIHEEEEEEEEEDYDDESMQIMLCYRDSLCSLVLFESISFFISCTLLRISQ